MLDSVQLLRLPKKFFSPSFSRDSNFVLKSFLDPGLRSYECKQKSIIGETGK
jgi:hypothetical protein